MRTKQICQNAARSSCLHVPLCGLFCFLGSSHGLKFETRKLWQLMFTLCLELITPGVTKRPLFLVGSLLLTVTVSIYQWKLLKYDHLAKKKKIEPELRCKLKIWIRDKNNEISDHVTSHKASNGCFKF